MAFDYQFSTGFTGKKKAAAWAESFLNGVPFEVKTVCYGESQSKAHYVMLDYQYLEAAELRAEGWNIV
jgi:hypothetical protein